MVTAAAKRAKKKGQEAATGASGGKNWQLQVEMGERAGENGDDVSLVRTKTGKEILRYRAHCPSPIAQLCTHVPGPMPTVHGQDWCKQRHESDKEQGSPAARHYFDEG